MVSPAGTAPEAVVPYRVRQFQERERAILRTAAELLAEQGFRETSMDQIAARLGIAKGTLYQHFAGKEALLAALFELRLGDLLDALRQARAEAPDPAAALRAVVGLLLRSRGGWLRLAGQMADAPLPALREHPAVKARLDAVHAELAGMIDRGKAAGAFSSAIPTAVAARGLIALARMDVYRSLLEAGDLGEEALADTLATLYLGGLAAPGPAS